MKDVFVKWRSLRGIGEPGNTNYELALGLKEIIDSITMPGMNCIDVGANYGWAAWCFLKKIGKEGRVISWEPNTHLLNEHLARWPLLNLTCLPYAASDRNGISTLWVHSLTGASSGHNSLERTRGGDIALPIKCKKIDTWWNSAGNIPIHVIKINAESHDLKVLYGAEHLLKKCHPWLIVEQNDKATQTLLQTKKYYQYKLQMKQKTYFNVWKHPLTSIR